MPRIVCLVATVFVLQSSIAFAQNGNFSASELEAKALESLRKTVAGGKLACEVHLTSSVLEVFAEIDAAFDESRVQLKQRFRRKFDESALSDWIGPTYIILADGIALSRDASVEHSAFKEDQSSYPDVYASKRIFWPQFIGTSTYGVWEMPDHSPRGILEQDDREVQSVTEAVEDGEKIVRVDYRLKDRSDLSIWFAPDQNGLVRRMKQSVKSPSGMYKRNVDVQLKEWAPSLWFPEQVRTTVSHADMVQSDEMARVLSFDPAKPSDEIFGVIGLEMPVGEVVADTTSGAVSYVRFSGNSLEPMSKSQIRETFPPTQVPSAESQIRMTVPEDRGLSFRGILIVVNLIVVGTVAGLLVFRLFRSR